VLVVGLTGGIGAGKSTLAKLLAARGAEVIDVDALGRQVIAPGGSAEESVRARFGTTDRAELARLVFSDPSARQALEAISWPAIDRELESLLARSSAEVVVLDMAVLAQGDLGKGLYQVVVTVEAPEDVRLERLVGRGMSRDDARNRMASQVSEERRRGLAHYAVENDAGPAELEKAAAELWEALATRA
jgi:dephospho-CoA kinase